MAVTRKGGAAVLPLLLSEVPSKDTISMIGDERFLAMMTRCVFQAGFSWRVIANKWTTFEEAFHGFDIATLNHLSIEDWDGYLKDTRIVRHGQKIKSVKDNAAFVARIAQEHGSFARFIAQWPESDLIGLWKFLKTHGSRLGGNTGQYFLRFMGKDCFILSADVTEALRQGGLDISERPTTQRDLKKVQATFNRWHEETGMPYTHLSQIAAYSIGPNYDAQHVGDNQPLEL